jgi:hypothetical protein
VPDVKKLAKKEEKKDKPKPKAKKGERGRGKPAPKRGAAVTALLKAVSSSKVAQYLAAKGAPVLLKGIGMLRKLTQNEQTHDDAAEKLKQSEKAVVIPPSEGQSKSNADQVKVVGDRPAPTADENKGKRKLQDSLKENTPGTLEDVDNFKRDQKAQHMGADVMGVVLVDKNAVVSTFDDLTQTPPPTPPEQTPEDLPPEEMAPRTANMNLGQGAIAPLQKEHTDVSNYTKEADSKLKEEGVTQEQLDMVDSGDLAEANKEKKGLESKAKTEPLAIQKFAQQETTKVDQDLKQEEKIERDRMKAKRKADLGATAQKQKGAKSDLEKKREEVAGKINGIYQAAQDKVKKRLADLETQSMKRFDEGNAKATKEFEDNVNRELDAFKGDRYSGFFGWERKAKDWLLGMDELPEVKAIFERNRAAFVTTINKLVEDISADNKRVIQECKDELANAKKEIKEFVDTLEPGLKDIGKKAAEEMEAKLDQLDQFVAKKEQELQDKLKDKQQAAIKAIDEKIEKMKEAMSGALAKLGKLLLWAAKKFFTWALEKFGLSLADIEGIINKGAAVLKAIFTKPIQFVKNLINAAVTGFKNFGKNFLTHLKNAVFEWLTGSLQGLILPETWDLKGILSVALQMLGLTWTNIRGKLVKLMGEPIVKGLETTFTLVKTLVTQGPMAAWEQLKEMADEMKEAFIEAVKDFIKVKIVEKAIETIASIFVPGAGIIRAIIGIYDTIVFFIQKAKDIIQMVGNFLGSIAEIAAGNIGAAADALEKGLARALKLVIDFLARFLRLSGITKKIQRAIEKIRGKVDTALDKVVKWIADKAKALVKKVVTAGVPKDPKERLEAALTAAQRATDKFADKPVGNIVLSPILSGIKMRYQLRSINLTNEGDRWAVEAEVNPKARKVLKARFQGNIAESKQISDVNKIVVKEDGKMTGGARLVASKPFGSFRSAGEQQHTIAYVANIPLYAFEANKTADSVAKRYREEAFNQKSDADKRFAMVIGLNAVQDPKNQNEKMVEAKTTANWPSQQFRLGVFSFLWQPHWENDGKTINNIVSFYNNVSTGDKAKDQEVKDRIESEHKRFGESKNKGKYPYGVFRDAVKAHEYTPSFISKMQQNAQNVMLYSGDPDAVSFKAANEHVEPGKELNELVRKTGESLFNRYDALLKKQIAESGGKLPLIISGGYNFAVRFNSEGEIDSTSMATALASMLDMQIRVAMSKENPLAVYFPEPNTLFNVTGTNKKAILNASYGIGAPEGKNYTLDIIKKRGVKVSAAFDHVEITTGDDVRFEVKDAGKAISKELGFKGKIMIGYLNPDVQGIRAIMRQPQSMAQSSTWVNQVGVIFGFGNHLRSEMWRNDISNIYKCYERQFNPIWQNYDQAASAWRRGNPDPAVSLDVLRKIMIEKLQDTAVQIKDTVVPDDMLSFPGISAFLDLPDIGRKYSNAEKQRILSRAKTQIPKLAEQSFLARIQFVVNGLSRKTD